MKLINVKNVHLFVREGTCDEGVAGEVIKSDCYKLRDIHLRDKPNIVDVGGHIGSFTLFASHRWPQAKHWVYEANPSNWSILRRNLGPLEDRVTILEGACVGKIPVNKRLIINAKEATTITGGWGINFSDKEVEEPSTVATQDITSWFNLHDVLAQVDKIDILKLDCEGSEFSIINDLSEEDLHKIDYIVAEIHVGATTHTPINYPQLRAKLLKQFVCPVLEERVSPTIRDIFNIVACNRKLIPK